MSTRSLILARWDILTICKMGILMLIAILFWVLPVHIIMAPVIPSIQVLVEDSITSTATATRHMSPNAANNIQKQYV